MIYLRGKAEPQIKELLTNYGPICLIWFDTPRTMTKEQGLRFIDIVHTLQPATLIDGRLGTPGDYVSTGDNRIPDKTIEGDWEVPATINHTWGFRKDDTDWKSPEDLTFKLVDIASKGGNYLLNVGPMSDGVIPQASQDNLRAVGQMAEGERRSHLRCRPHPHSAMSGARRTTPGWTKSGKPVFVQAKDWRCTTKPGKLYITLFKWPGASFEVSKVNGKVGKAYLLSDGSHKSLKMTQTGDTVKVALPAAAPDATATVLVLQTK